MEAIEQLGNRLASIKIFEMIDAMFGTAKYQKLVPDMVRDRLTRSGTYSTGEEIRTYRADLDANYAAFTISEKERKGQISSHVTLKDTGQFYNTFNLLPKQTYAVIEYDEKKPDGLISENVDFDNIFNLSEGEMNRLRIEVLPDLVKSIKLKLSA